MIMDLKVYIQVYIDGKYYTTYYYQEVKQGQTIATVGNTARFEIADQTHLHFEIKKDGENVDPNIYLK